MHPKKAFIAELLRSVAPHLERNGGDRSADYSYWKGYCAQADIWVHEYITTRIMEHFCGSYIYSEEDAVQPISHLGSDEYLWILDPICGSTNYVRGIPFYTHALSVLDQDGVLFSGIYDPLRDELFLADRESFTLNDHPVYASDAQDLCEAIVSVNTNQSDWKDAISINTLINAFSPPDVRRVRIMESANLEMAYVAAGRIDAYINPVDKVWDVAAGSLMLASAGGQFKAFEGSLETPFNCRGAIASNGHLMEAILNKV